MAASGSSRCGWSGSYGELVAYAVMKGSELSPITLPELTGANAKGYQGHDEFQVVEACLARRFPIYKPGWILRPTSVLQF